MKPEWKYIDKDGNPSKEGCYHVVLLYNDEREGGMVAEFTERYFSDYEKVKGWEMCNQPKEGLVWSEECGSSEGEVVWAWLPNVQFMMPELPEGVKWCKEQRGDV